MELFPVLVSLVMGKKEALNFFWQVEEFDVWFFHTIVMVSIYMQVTCISLKFYRIIV